MDRLKAHLNQQLVTIPKAQKSKMIRKRMNTARTTMMNGEMMIVKLNLNSK